MRRFGIKGTLVLAFVLVATIPILVLGWLQGEKLVRHEIQVSDIQGRNLAEGLAREIRLNLEHHIAALDTIAEQATHLDRIRGPELQRNLELYRNKFRLKYVYVIGLEGKVTAAFPLLSSTGTPNIGVDFSDREYFQVTRETGKPFIAHVRMGRLSGKPVFGLAVPVWNKKRDRLLAVVGSSLAPSDIYAIAEPIMRNSPELEFTVTDGLEQVVIERGVPTPKEIVSFSGDPLFADAGPSGAAVIREGNLGAHGAVRAAVADMRTFNISWSVAVYKRRSQVMALADAARRNALAIAALALGAGLLVALWISSRISGPVLDLIAAMRGIEKGEYEGSRAAGRNFRVRELSEAWTALGTMASRLRASTESLERKLDDQKVKSLSAARLASLGEMSAGIAHEINNPLAVIAVVAHELKKRVQLGEHDREILLSRVERIQATVVRIGRIIDGLRSFSREASGDPYESAELGAILSGTMDLCRQRIINSNVSLELPDEASLRTRIECRSVQISQLLLNLLSNSFDAVESKGADKRIRLELLDHGDEVEIAVIDNGCGVPPELRERIFEPFVTTKPVGRGTGLGLSISKGIAESHGGSLRLDAEASMTRMVLTLPKAQGASAE